MKMKLQKICMIILDKGKMHDSSVYNILFSVKVNIQRKFSSCYPLIYIKFDSYVRKVKKVCIVLKNTLGLVTFVYIKLKCMYNTKKKHACVGNIHNTTYLYSNVCRNVL